MSKPNIENKDIFHDWQPRELMALVRATAILQSLQPEKNTIKMKGDSKTLLRGKSIKKHKADDR